MVALLSTPMPAHAAADTIRLPLSAKGGRGADRRVFPRREMSAEIQGKRLDHSLPALRQPSLTLSIRDVSLGGLSAISNTPLVRGERITVAFPTLSLAGGLRQAGGWDAVGRVVRCETSGLGYRVAVEFESVPLAA